MNWREAVQALHLRLERMEDTIREASAAQDDAEALLAAAVAEARRQGLSWEEVARALGITKQSAHQRFRHVERG